MYAKSPTRTDLVERLEQRIGRFEAAVREAGIEVPGPKEQLYITGAKSRPQAQLSAHFEKEDGRFLDLHSEDASTDEVAVRDWHLHMELRGGQLRGEGSITLSDARLLGQQPVWGEPRRKVDVPGAIENGDALQISFADDFKERFKVTRADPAERKVAFEVDRPGQRLEDEDRLQFLRAFKPGMDLYCFGVSGKLDYGMEGTLQRRVRVKDHIPKGRTGRVDLAMKKDITGEFAGISFWCEELDLDRCSSKYLLMPLTEAKG